MEATETENSSAFRAPDIEQLAPVFPQLEVLRLVGSGGMGYVYEARQPHLDRIVALKILPPVLACDPKFSERFAREARALAKLNHPNILQCYDFGRSAARDGRSSYFYLLLEYVDGVNLRQTMKTGSLTAREALMIVPRLCDALQHAHKKGVLHRDIKPENILIDKQGRVKIADFGLARFQPFGESGDIALTASGALLGTAAYMAPEQIEQPRDVDHRADIYSLGVVFYEMLTGGLPLGRFAAPSETTGVDQRLDSVVFRTLEKQADRRYQSAGDVRTEVETIAGTPTRKGRAAAFSTAEHPTSPTALRTADAVAFPPSWMTASTWFWRQFLFLRRGQLRLEPDRLLYETNRATLTIPLKAMENVAPAPMPFFMEPLGRCPIAIRWRDAAGTVQNTRILVSPWSWFTPLIEEHRRVDDWVRALDAAIAGSTDVRSRSAQESSRTCAEMTPPPPPISLLAYGVSVLAAAVFALLLASLGFELWLSSYKPPASLFGLFLLALSLLVMWMTCTFVIGIWRRRKPSPIEAESSDDQSRSRWSRRELRRASRSACKGVRWARARISSRFPTSRSGFEDAAGIAAVENREPTWSGLAVMAFLFATLGWTLFMVGPIIGCVLGWMALLRIKRDEAKRDRAQIKGRGMALFAALQVPFLVLLAVVGGGSFGLWHQGLMPLDDAIAVLLLAVVVFLLVRFISRLAGSSGLWQRYRKAGIAVLLSGACLLIGGAWAVDGWQERWPFHGSLVHATVYHHGVDRREIRQDLREGLFGDRVHVWPFSKNADETHLFAVAARREAAETLLERAGDDLRGREPDLDLHVAPNVNWPREQGEEVRWVSFAVIGCGAGLLFGLAGSIAGGTGLLLSVVMSLMLVQSSTPFPLGFPLQESAPRSAVSPDNRPEHEP